MNNDNLKGLLGFAVAAVYVLKKLREGGILGE